MKFAYFTDSHIRAKTPSARNDKSFLATTMAKLRYVFTWCRNNDIKTVLCAGDLGDSPNWGQNAILEFIKLRNEFYEIQMIVVPGNHDVYSEEVGLYSDYALGLFEEAQVLRVLYGGQHTMIDEDLAVYGFGYGELVTDELLEGRFLPHADHKSIALVHATIGPGDTFGWKAIEKQNIKGFNLALFGDVHCGFDPFKFKSGSVAYSCGALVRLTKPEKTRPVRFGVFEVGEKLDIRAVTIPTDEALFSDDVDAVAELCSKNIFQTLQEVDEHEPESLLAVLEQIAESNKISKEAFDMVSGMVKHG